MTRLERIGDFLGHIILVVLGQNVCGEKRAVSDDATLGDNALPLAEKVGQNAGIKRRHFRSAVMDDEHVVLSVLLPGLFEHQPAQPDRRARRNLAFGNFRRRIEKHNLVAQCSEDQSDRQCQNHSQRRNDA